MERQCKTEISKHNKQTNKQKLHWMDGGVGGVRRGGRWEKGDGGGGGVGSGETEVGVRGWKDGGGGGVEFILWRGGV